MAKTGKKRQILEKERQDALGISRKKYKHTVKPETFFIIKLSLIVAIPIVYFVYSPLLILVFIAYVGLFFLARMAEHSMNRSVIRSNHIRIFKFDSAIALIVIIISLVGVCMSGSKAKTPMFDDMPKIEVSDFMNAPDFGKMRRNKGWSEFTRGLKNFGSLLTGERSVFKSSEKPRFGFKEPPEGFTPPEDFTPPPRGGRGFDMRDLPIDYVFSSAFSTVNAVLIFATAGFGLISLLAIYLKKRKFDYYMNELITDGKITALSDEELDRILSFGEEVSETDVRTDELIEKHIAEQAEKDCTARAALKEISDTGGNDESVAFTGSSGCDASDEYTLFSTGERETDDPPAAEDEKTDAAPPSQKEYMFFGEYPQSVKAESVSIVEKQNGSIYYIGSDGERYMRKKAKPGENAVEFSDGTKIVEDEEYFFRVQPIKWRVFAVPEGKLLISEKILDTGAFGRFLINDYSQSDLRARLNDDFSNRAFSAEEKAKILTVEVDNSLSSTTDNQNGHTCENTFDKVFLPSVKQIKDLFPTEPERIKAHSDYALAKHLYVYGGNGCWWTRTPAEEHIDEVRDVNYNGTIGENSTNEADEGIVPAIVLSNK